MNEDANGDAIQISAAVAEAVVQRAADVVAAGMPLAAGLRAAAAEADSFALSRALMSIAADLDRGKSIDDCLESRARRLPPHLVGLIRAARRTGDVGPMLAEWIENRRAARMHWRGVLAPLVYPAISALLAVVVFMMFAVAVVRPFKQMLEEFGLKLPYATVHVIAFSEFASRVLPACLGAAAVLLIAVRVFGGRAGWSLLMTSLPLIGNAWHWTGVAEMLRCLSLLVAHRVPLGEALRLTADGVTDEYVGSQCRSLATRVERGTSLTMSLIDLRTLPLSIAPLVHWGERHDSLSESLRSAAEMIEGRLKFRTDMLVQIIPPILLLFVGATVVSGVVGLFLPLISLIQGLS